MKITNIIIRSAWKRAILAMKLTPFRFVRPAAKLTLKAKMKARESLAGSIGYFLAWWTKCGEQ